MAKTIRLTQGKTATVDDEDYARLSANRWYAARFGRRGTWYAVRMRKVNEAPGPGLILMHREILGLVDPRVLADHENHDGLDNRRQNLRAASPSANSANSRKTSGTSSRYKGVCRAPSGRWRAQIMVGGVHRHLGTHLLEEDAARAYDDAALEAWGPFAWTNSRSHSLSLPAAAKKGRAA